jgi:hypothetical protein
LRPVAHLLPRVSSSFLAVVVLNVEPPLLFT